MSSITKLTQEYVVAKPAIKKCLQQNLINFSALARQMSKDMNRNDITKDAIVIAARRLRDSLKKEQKVDSKIHTLLSKSELEVKTKISVNILRRDISWERIDTLQKEIRKQGGILYVLEGAEHFTFITQNRFCDIIQKSMSTSIIQQTKDLAMISIISPKEIEEYTGVLGYLTSLLASHDVNILEFFSTWTDTVVVISTNDVQKTLEALHM